MVKKVLLFISVVISMASFSMELHENEPHLNLVIFIDEYDASIKSTILRDVVSGIIQKQNMIINVALFQALLDLRDEDLLQSYSTHDSFPRYIFYKELISEILDGLTSSWNVYLSKHDDFVYLTPMSSHGVPNLLPANISDIENKFLSYKIKNEYFSQYNINNLSDFINTLLGEKRCSIILVGHGFIDKNSEINRHKSLKDANPFLRIDPVLSTNRAAGLSEQEYRNLLKNLSTLPCDSLAVLSCFLGGENLVSMHSDPKTREIDTYPFDLVVLSLGDMPSSKRDVFMNNENKKSIEKSPVKREDFNTGLRFDLFFNNMSSYFEEDLSRQEKYAVLSKSIESMHGVYFPLQTWPLFKKKNTKTFFKALDIDPSRVLIADHYESLKDEITYYQGYKGSPHPFSTFNQEAILLYKSVWERKININGSVIPKLISMIPGDAKHYMDSISATTIRLDDLIEKMFLPSDTVNSVGQARIKTFFIKELICLDNLITIMVNEGPKGEFATRFGVKSEYGLIKLKNVLIEVVFLQKTGLSARISIPIGSIMTATKSSNMRLYSSYDQAKQTFLKNWDIQYNLFGDDNSKSNNHQSPYISHVDRFEHEKSFANAVEGKNVRNAILKRKDLIEKRENSDTSDTLYIIPPASSPIAISSPENDAAEEMLGNTARATTPCDEFGDAASFINSNSPGVQEIFFLPFDNLNSLPPSETTETFERPF